MLLIACTRVEAKRFLLSPKEIFFWWKEAKNNKAWIFVGLEEKIGELVQFQI
jgi:hypothetical protein